MKRFAKIIRTITLPPFMASAFFTLIYFLTEGIYSNLAEYLLSIFFIGILPVIIYPVSLSVPKLRKKGRAWQRDAAIFFSVISYAGMIIFLSVAGGTAGLWVIMLTYLFSGIGLLLFNICHVKSSGHACAIVGPLSTSVYFLGPYALFGLIIPVLVFWSSLRNKSHTAKELFIGSLVPLFSLGLSLLVSQIAF